MTAVSLRGMQSNEGVGREFEFIIAAVVGGCLLTGGYGSVVGAAFGAAIIGMAQIGIISLGLGLELGVLLRRRGARRRGDAEHGDPAPRRACEMT